MAKMSEGALRHKFSERSTKGPYKTQRKHAAGHWMNPAAPSDRTMPAVHSHSARPKHHLGKMSGDHKKHNYKRGAKIG